MSEMISWRGKLLEDMTREELIDALRQSGNAMRQQHEDTQHAFNVLAQARATNGYHNRPRTFMGLMQEMFK